MTIKLFSERVAGELYLGRNGSTLFCKTISFLRWKLNERKTEHFKEYFSLGRLSLAVFTCYG